MSKLTDYINNELSIDDEYYAIFNKKLPQGKFFCPWHHNVNTPAAKRYGNGIKCFGLCQKYYTVYDLLKTFNPARIEEIKSTVILDNASESNLGKFIKIVNVDRSLPLSEVLDFIVNNA